MSDYVKITDFAAKDALPQGDPAKVVTGTAHDNEYNAIAVAVATKYDSTDLASQVQAEAGANNTALMTPLRVAQAITALAAGGATYDPAAVAITGGTVNGTIIGGTVPQAVTGTTVTGTTVNANTTLQIGGVAVTSTAAELNILDGVTATATELNYNDITTLGTAQASKAVTVSAGGAINFAGMDLTNVDIDSGSVDGATIGAASHNSGKFTTLQATGTATFGAEVVETTGTLTQSGANLTIDPVNGTIQTLDLTQSVTSVTSNLAIGESITLRIADGASTYSITWGASVTWVGGSSPSLPTSGYAWVTLWNVAGTTFGAYTGNTA